jgi:hypothetical protein
MDGKGRGEGRQILGPPQAADRLATPLRHWMHKFVCVRVDIMSIVLVPPINDLAICVHSTTVDLRIFDANSIDPIIHLILVNVKLQALSSMLQ